MCICSLFVLGHTRAHPDMVPDVAAAPWRSSQIEKNNLDELEDWSEFKKKCPSVRMRSKCPFWGQSAAEV